MSENKVTFGLKNAHYAPITINETTGAITYGTPKPLPGSVELGLEPRGDMAEFYADDMLYYSAENNQGYDGTLNIANIAESFLIDVLNEEKDEIDGVITEKSNVETNPFALMFEFDGDVKAIRHILYNCSAKRPKISSSTRTNSKEPNTNELTFVSSPRQTDLKVKTKTTTSTPQTVYDAWYTKVYEKSTDITPPTVTVSPADGATTIAVDSDIVWTFSESIKSEDVITSNFLVIDATGTEVSGTLTISDDKKVVTFNPTLSLAALTAYTAIALKNIRDLSGNTLAVNSITNFTTV